MQTYDVIVLGTGGVGSAAAMHLASRGARVLSLDRFAPGHDRGSSHGHTRIIRQAYFGHPDYVPLLLRSYVLWRELEAATGQSLMQLGGLLEVGPPDGVVVPGVLASASQHQLAIDQLTREEVHREWPGFVVDDGSVAVFERQAGWLWVEECVRAHAARAEALGATLQSGCEVLGWQATSSGVEVWSAAERWSADRLVVTAGAWSSAILRDLRLHLRVVKKHQHWFSADRTKYDAAKGCPGFFYEVPEGYYYGMPHLGERGLKVAEHSGGEPEADPLRASLEVDPLELARVEQFLAGHLPAVSRRPIAHAICFYTLTPDEHFVVDRHPVHEQVCFAAGLSGHGFKFTSALGEALADMALGAETQQPLDFLSLHRSGLSAGGS